MPAETAGARLQRKEGVCSYRVATLLFASSSSLACAKGKPVESYSTRGATFEAGSQAEALDAGSYPAVDAFSNADAGSPVWTSVSPVAPEVRDGGEPVDAGSPASAGIDSGSLSTQDIAIDVCAPGSFVPSVSASSERECRACESGTYSTGVNSDRCETWTDCGWAPVEVSGAATHDVECQLGGRFRQFGSIDSDTVSSIAVGPDGDVFVAGLAGEGFPGFPSYASNDCYVAAYTPAGQLQSIIYLDCGGHDADTPGMNTTTDYVLLLRVGTYMVAIWADVDKPAQLVASPLPASVGIQATPETRLELGFSETEFSGLDDVSVNGVAALGSDEMVVVATRRSSDWSLCGDAALFRIHIGQGLITRHDIAPREPCVSWGALAVVNDRIYLAGNQTVDGYASGVLEIRTLEDSLLSELSFDASLGTLESLAIDPLGNPILAFATQVDAVIHKFDPTGERLWSTTLRGAYHHPRLRLNGKDTWITGGTDLVLTENGYDGLGANYGSLDAYVARLTEGGEVTWLSQLGSTRDDAGRGLDILGDDVYLVGATDGEVATRVGELDGFLVQMNTIAATVEESKE